MTNTVAIYGDDAQVTFNSNHFTNACNTSEAQKAHECEIPKAVTREDNLAETTKEQLFPSSSKNNMT